MVRETGLGNKYGGSPSKGHFDPGSHGHLSQQVLINTQKMFLIVMTQPQHTNYQTKLQSQAKLTFHMWDTEIDKTDRGEHWDKG